MAQGDIGISRHKAAIRQRASGNFQNCAIWANPLETVRHPLRGQGHAFLDQAVDIARAVLAALGIVSERDCLWKVIAEGRSPRTVLVKDIMTPVAKMRTVHPGQSVAECMELMTCRRHRHLPVVDDGKLVGLVSIGDVVKSTIDAQQATIQSLEKYITGTY